MTRTRRHPAGLLAVHVIMCAAAISAATRQQPGADAQARTVRVMTYNIKHGQSNARCEQPPAAPGQPPSADCNLNLAGTIAVIREHKPDIVALQEVDRFWSRSAHADQPAVMAAELKMHQCYGANLDHPADNHADRPHQYGTALVSRFPLASCANTPLTTSPGWEPRGLLAAIVDINGVKLRVYSTHLQANRSMNGVSESGAPQRTMQTQEILKHLSDVVDPIVLMGDFNAGELAPEMFRLTSQFFDVWRTMRASMGYTSPALLGDQEPTTRLDYIFISRSLEMNYVDVPIDPRTRRASDHYPVVAGLTLPRSPARR